MRLKLTELAIQSFKPSSPQQDYYDTLLPGFLCRVGLRRKTFQIMAGKKRARITLGHYPGMRLGEAREAARLKMADPLKPQQIAVLEASEAYLAAIKVRPNTHRYYRQFQRKLVAKYGGLHLDQLTPRMLADILESPAMHLALTVFFNWCCKRALLEKSPMQHVGAPGKFKTRDRVLTDDEIKRVWLASKQLGKYGIVIRLCLLTGQRIGEVLSVSPKIFTENTLTLSAAMTKNKREHSIPLTTHSFALLDNSPFPRMNVSRYKKQLDQISGVSDFTHHDLRRTFATTLASLAVPVHIIERLLNHTSGSISGVAAVYNRFSYQNQIREALELHEKRLAEIVGEPLI